VHAGAKLRTGHDFGYRVLFTTSGLEVEGFFDSWQGLIEGLLSKPHCLEQPRVAKLVELSRGLQEIDRSLRSPPRVFEERLLPSYRSHGQRARLSFSPTQRPWRHPAMTRFEKWQAPMPGLGVNAIWVDFQTFFQMSDGLVHASP
jgi:hypothetical protein